MATAKDNDSADTSAPHNWRDAVRNDRLAHLIRDAGRSMSRALHIRLMDHSVSLGHWSFLRILWERDGLTQRELSILAGVREPTTHGALQVMEKLGYITRRKLPLNMRNICIFLTPEGRALKDVLVPLAEQVNKVAIRGIPTKDVSLIREGLLAIIQNLEHDEVKSNRRVPPSRKMV